MSNASSDFSRGFLSILSDKEFNRNRKTLCESKKITFHNSDYNWCIRCDKIFCTNCSLTHLLENQIGHTPIEEIFINKDKLDAIFEKEVNNLNDLEARFKQYNKQLNELDCRQVYKDLLEMCNYTNIALLCFETPQTFCHRHLVVDWFNKNGIPAQEIYYGTTSR